MHRALLVLTACLITGMPVLVVTGCGEDADDAASSAAATAPVTTTPATTTDRPAATETASEGTPATDAVPEFSGTLAGGGSFDDSMVTAKTVIHVFASWCPTCRADAPDFAEFQRENPDLTYLYIAVEDKPADTAAFMKEFGFAPGKVINDQDRSVEEAFGLTGQPNTVFVPADGDLTKIIGPADTERLNQAAAQL